MSRAGQGAWLGLLALLGAAWATPALADQQQGLASWYGPRHHGRPRADGRPFNMHGSNAAHRSLPLGTRLLVTNLANGRQTRVVVRDRGPYHGGRILDLSRASAEALGMRRAGVARVQLQVLR